MLDPGDSFAHFLTSILLQVNTMPYKTVEDRQRRHAMFQAAMDEWQRQALWRAEAR